MNQTQRRGSTLIELIIAMSLTLLVSGVLFFTYVTGNKNTDRGVEILDFMRKATILVENVKVDIRSATRRADSIKAEGTTVTVEKSQGNAVVTVSYTFDAQKHLVTRKQGNEQRILGGDGASGNILSFSVLPVDKLPGFYKIDVTCETIAKLRDPATSRAAAALTPGPRTPGSPAVERKAYAFHSLVNRRTPDEGGTDIQWNNFYPD